MVLNVTVDKPIVAFKHPPVTFPIALMQVKSTKITVSPCTAPPLEGATYAYLMKNMLPTNILVKNASIPKT